MGVDAPMVVGVDSSMVVINIGTSTTPAAQWQERHDGTGKGKNSDWTG